MIDTVARRMSYHGVELSEDVSDAVRPYVAAMVRAARTRRGCRDTFPDRVGLLFRALDGFTHPGRAALIAARMRFMDRAEVVRWTARLDSGEPIHRVRARLARDNGAWLIAEVLGRWGIGINSFRVAGDGALETSDMYYADLTLKVADRIAMETLGRHRVETTHHPLDRRLIVRVVPTRPACAGV